MMLKRILLLVSWLSLALVACGGEELPSDGPLVVAEDSVVGQTLLNEAATPTLLALVVETEAVASATEVVATAVSAPEAAEPTSVPIEEEIGADGDGAGEELGSDLPTSLAVGESARVLLSAGELAAFSFAGTQFEPVMFFVEAVDGLDVSLQIFGETVDGAPLREANFSGNGRPEIMVFSPQTTGLFHVAVQAVAGAGEARLYAYAAGMEGMAVSQQDGLAAGQSNRYEVVSQNGRPVIAYADPAAGIQADLRIQFATSDGTIVADANFGGGGSAEASFVLPLETTPYTITISEVSGAAATYDIVIVTLD